MLEVGAVVTNVIILLFQFIHVSLLVSLWNQFCLSEKASWYSQENYCNRGSNDQIFKEIIRHINAGAAHRNNVKHAHIRRADQQTNQCQVQPSMVMSYNVFV